MVGVPAAAKELGLHESQLYGWRTKARAERSQSDTECAQAGEIARLKRQLSEREQELAIAKKAAKKFKATTNSKHDLPVAPNLLEQDFTATAPNQKYVGDTTYLGADEEWLYLAGVIGLYTRLVVGWSMPERMTAQLVCNALQMALRRHCALRPWQPVLFEHLSSLDCPAPFNCRVNRTVSI